MTTQFAYKGTVSHGTLRSEDLIIAFLPILEDLDKSAFLQVVNGDEPKDTQIIGLLHIDGSTTLPDHLQEAASELVEWMIEHLDAVAPDGYRFGTTEGDGSDFGFWEEPELDDDGVTDRYGVRV